MKTAKTAGRLYGALCAFCATVITVTFASYLISSSRTAFTLETRLFPLLAILCALVPPFFARFVPWRRFGMFLRIGYLCGMLCFTVTFFAFALSVRAETAAQPTRDVSVVLVFGSKTAGYGPGREMRLRLNRAAAVLRDYPDAVCIVSGGQGADEPTAEAFVMRDYLIDNGIAATRIYTEAEAHNTRENLENAFRLMEKEGLPKDGILCVSGCYHMPRIRMLAARLGQSVETVGATVDWFDILPDLGREYMALVKSFLA